MSEQTETLTFGPQWLRDLSNGTNVRVPPPSPGPKCKLAQFRYGKEEMLALFSKEFQPPNIGEVGEFILTQDIRQPLAYMPMTEEEQRNSFGSLNSSAVLKMMGRGGQRGGRGSSRGGRGSGRGRGEGGFHRGISMDETSTKSEEGWQRDSASRTLSWGDNGRGGFPERGSSREPEMSSRGFESSAPPVRHKEPSRALSSGNWRSSESGEGDDDGGGWIVSGSRGSERSERWRGSPRDGWHSHSQGSREDHSRGEQGHGERHGDSWNQGIRDKNNFDELPEWSRSDSVFEPDLGSFDSSGAFCVVKDKKELNDTGQTKLANDSHEKEDWDKELNDEHHDISENAQTKFESHDHNKATTKENSAEKKKKNLEGNNAQQKKNLEDLQENMTDVQQQANVKEDELSAQPKEDQPNGAPDREETASIMKSKPMSTPSCREESNTPTPVTTSHDEIGADLERVAESCIANLDVEGEEPAEQRVRSNSVETASVADRLQSSPVEDQTKWYYRDPQGQEQGPFGSEEMVEWFHHGYFTMQLSIRRQCDVMYLPLGEVIKRWGRVPFLPGPAPPPITHHQLMTEQTMFMQQQFLQQHYQQLQKQAILQQIQHQHQQQQDQQREHSEPSLHLTINRTVDHSVHPSVLGPRSHPVTSHAVSSGGAAEVIWGTDPEHSKGSWSPVSTSASVWDQTNRQNSPVPSVKEAQRGEEEKAKAEAEKREAELMALKQKEEEKRQMLKKQEEERLQREALQRENDLRLQKQKQKEEEEERQRQEKERRRLEIQKQTEAVKRKEAARQKKEVQQEQKQKKESEEQKQKQNEVREQQKQALMRLQQQQQRMEIQRQEQQRLEQQRQEEQNVQLLQHLQQKRMQSNSSSRWGSQNPAALSLSEIQEQEEKNRRAHEEKMRELEEKQRQLQSAASSHGWADKQNGPAAVKSLKDIQDEQARQLRSRQSKQPLRAQSAQVSISGPWANSWTAGNGNIWSGIGNHADLDEYDDKETGFWADAVRAASKTAKSQSQQPKTNMNQTKVSSTQSATNSKKSGKKATKEEESVRRLFQQSFNNDPFTEWCTQCLTGMKTSVDIPTFIAFLKDIESPYEIHNYVRDYLGDTNQAQSFAKEFIERKRAQKPAENFATTTVGLPSAATTTRCAPLAADVVPRGGGGANRTLPQHEPESKDIASGNSKNKKKKKQRMQKVDPSILGFSVNAAERVNMGEIQSVDD